MLDAHTPTHIPSLITRFTTWLITWYSCVHWLPRICIMHEMYYITSHYKRSQRVHSKYFGNYGFGNYIAEDCTSQSCVVMGNGMSCII